MFYPFRNLFCGCCEQSVSERPDAFAPPSLPPVGMTDEFLHDSPQGKDGSCANAVNDTIPLTRSGGGETQVPPNEGEEGNQNEVTASGRSNASRASSLTPEEKEREKLRLQRLVKDFAKEAVGGMEVAIIDAESGDKHIRHMLMDRYLSKLRIKETPESKEVTEYAMRDIASIYKGADVLAKDPRLPEALALSAVGFDVSHGKDKAVLFWFPDSYNRDKFYTCLKILRMSVELNQTK
eukprot:TRINITY_DN47914_c0_g1_i1.p1 TRINITY_DN47914_c0_g1~~TRINITY_DN47914_c0_g1_i1.p1  ORF type:complete len:237 (+),score=30.87 TRINITY_DN47914_c0_g1_i1:144-854(+)